MKLSALGTREVLSILEDVRSLKELRVTRSYHDRGGCLVRDIRALSELASATSHSHGRVMENSADLILDRLGAIAIRQLDKSIDITQRIAPINMVQTVRQAQQVTIIRRRDCTSPQYGGTNGHQSPLNASGASGTRERIRPAEDPILDCPAIHSGGRTPLAKRPRTLRSPVTRSTQSVLQDLGSSTPHARFSECNPSQQTHRPGLQDVDFTEPRGQEEKMR
jgi:hypothetical protein